VDARKPIIIVVEDDPQSAEALRYVLADWGAQVVFGLTLEAVLDDLGPRRDAIAMIADFHLGGGRDGVALSQALRPHLPQARVLVLSGSYYGRAAHAAEMAGYDLMHKPAAASNIIAWVERG